MHEGPGEYNKMSIPLKKLKFINHPRYGRVYPFVCIDRRNEWANTARFSTFALSILNGLVLYSTFYMPIFTVEFSAIVANPFVLLPSLAANFYLYKTHNSLFYQDRSLVTNMFLKPNGRYFICETRAGSSDIVKIDDVFMTKFVKTRWETKIEFQHGANQYKQIRGNPRIFDSFVLENALDNRNIDTKNVEYDFDLTREFTWDFRELVEIKKRKRYVSRTMRPTFKVLNSVRSASLFEKAKRQGKLAVAKCTPFKGYDVYEYHED